LASFRLANRHEPFDIISGGEKSVTGNRWRLALALTCALATSGEAARLKVELGGFLYQISPSLSSAFRFSDPVAASFMFNPDDAGEAWYPGGVLDPHFRYYPDAPTGTGWMTVGSYRLSFGPASRMFVSDNERAGISMIDRVIFDDYDAAGSRVLGLPFYSIFFNWQDWSAKASQGLRLPRSQADFDRFGFPTGAIDWVRGDASNRVTFLMNHVTVQSVPEPESWAMLYCGLGLMGYAMRSGQRGRSLTGSRSLARQKLSDISRSESHRADRDLRP